MNVSSVIKLGGSLFDVPDLPDRLRNFLADFSRPRAILMCGGGEIVEQIRRWDRAYDIGEEASHWIALRALTITALALERIAPPLRHVESSRQFEEVWAAGGVPIYDAFRFISDVDVPSRDPLPRRWRVTSDSIAARVATLFGAGELVLLKSITLPEGTTVSDAARQGMVDPHFPVAAAGISRIVAVNFREPEPRETRLIAESS